MELIINDAYYIRFADDAVRKICAENWGDGKGITPEQAAKVTSLGNKFQGNSEITTFEEFKYFTGITKILSMTFYTCTSLMSITFPPGIIEAVGRDGYGEGPFAQCKSLTNVILNEGLRILADSTFLSTAISEIVIPSSVTQIRNSVFAYSNLHDLVLPDSLEYFGGVVLSNTYVRKIKIPDSVTVIGNGVGRGLGNKNQNSSEAIVVIGTGILKFEGCEFFRDCNAKSRILYIKAAIPPILPNTIYHSTSIIYVPKGTSNAYKTATSWKELSSIIQEYDFEENPNSI